jgi:hypothetical protein
MAAGDPTLLDPVSFLAAHGNAGEAGPVRATGGADTEVWRGATPLGPAAVRAFRAGEASRALRCPQCVCGANGVTARLR